VGGRGGGVGGGGGGWVVLVWGVVPVRWRITLRGGKLVNAVPHVSIDPGGGGTSRRARTALRTCPGKETRVRSGKAAVAAGQEGGGGGGLRDLLPPAAADPGKTRGPHGPGAEYRQEHAAGQLPREQRSLHRR